MQRLLPPLALLLLAGATDPAPEVLVADVVAGMRFDWSVTGLRPASVVRVHSVAQYPRWEPQTDGPWKPIPRNVHAWADFVADADGKVVASRSRPIAGTFTTIDPTAMIWSGRVDGDPQLPALPAISEAKPLGQGRIRVSAEQQDRVLAYSDFRILRGGSGIKTTEVRAEGLAGQFYSASDWRRKPAIIFLHGSEGGGDISHAGARDWAAQGYPVLAVDYFTAFDQTIPGTPSALASIPIEVVQRARDWLASRPEVDPERIAIFGISRGAELALLAARRMHWPRAVVACVPSDLTWPGHEQGKPYGAGVPAWTWRKAQLAYAPFIQGDFGEGRRFASMAAAFRASRAQYAEHPPTAKIRVQDIRARLLLLGGEADTTWPSADMARSIAETRKRAGLSSRTEIATFRGAGHGICGNGMWPTRLYGRDGEGDPKLSMDAEGQAVGMALRRTRTFLAKALR